MKPLLRYPALVWLLCCAAIICCLSVWSPGAILPAIVPAAVPTANKIGDGTRFQISAISSPGAAGTLMCDDGNGNTTESGCSGGGGGGTGSGTTVYSGLAGISLTGSIYFPFGGGSSASATEASAQVLVGSAVTISNFGARITTALGQTLGVDNSVVFTWRDNASSQTVTCTITNPATTCSDLAHNFTTAAGHLIDVQATFTGTISATPVFFLSAMTGTGSGNSITVGAIASLPGSCSISGNGYIATDSPYQFFCNGSTFDPYIYGYKVAQPKLANFTQVNTGQTTFDTANGGIGMQVTTISGDNIQELKDAGLTGAGPYTIDTAFVWTAKNGTVSTGLGLTDGTKLAMITIGWEGGAFEVKVVKFSNNTTFSSNQNQTVVNVTAPLIWLRIADDGTGSGTARSYFWSVDGYQWNLLLNEGHTTFLTATNGCLVVNNVNVSPPSSAQFFNYLIH